jgi:hypothetical protein
MVSHYDNGCECSGSVKGDEFLDHLNFSRRSLSCRVSIL